MVRSRTPLQRRQWSPLPECARVKSAGGPIGADRLARAAARLRVRRFSGSGARRCSGVLRPPVRGAGALAHLPEPLSAPRAAPESLSPTAGLGGAGGTPVPLRYRTWHHRSDLGGL